MDNISVALVEDHEMVRRMWVTLFESRPEITVIGESDSFATAVTMINERRPDIILLDINLPDTSGLNAVPRILEIAPDTRIIVVSMHNQPAYARKTLQLGAKAYVTKDASPDEIYNAIDAVMNNHTYLCKEVRENGG